MRGAVIKKALERDGGGGGGYRYDGELLRPRRTKLDQGG